jgi:hypothetical protein
MDWLAAKKEGAPSTMEFSYGSLEKFLQFLGQRADEAIRRDNKTGCDEGAKRANVERRGWNSLGPLEPFV